MAPNSRIPGETTMHGEIALNLSLPYVALARDKDYYLFRYTKGNEADLISTLIDYAEDERLNFTWLDVLLIMHQMKL